MTEEKTYRKTTITIYTKWFWEMKILIIGIGAIIVAMIDVVWFGTERSYSLAGFCLQFSGMLLAIKGVWDIPKQLNARTPIDVWDEWWERRPWTVKVAYGSANLTCKSGIKAEGSIGEWEDYNPDNTDTINIRNAFNNLNILKSANDNHKKAIAAIKDEADRDRKKVEEEIKELSEKTHKDRVKFHTSSFGWSLVGLFWVLAGIIISFIGTLIA